MRRLYLLSLLFPAAALASLDISADWRNGDVAPKSIITLPVVLQSDSATDVTLALDLPPGWQVISSLDARSVSPGTPQRALLSIALPADVPAGPAHIKIRGTSAAGDASADVVLNIGTTRSLQAAFERFDEMVWSNDQKPLAIRVTNSGNAAEDVRIKIDNSSNGWIVTPDEQVVTVPAMSTQVVILSVTAPRDLQQEMGGQVKILVGDIPLRASLTAVPRLSAQGADYPVLPSSFSMTSYDLQKGKFPKTRFEAHSGGAISEHRTISLDYRGTHFGNDNPAFYNILYKHQSGWEVLGGHSQARFALLPRDLDGEGVRVQIDRPTYRSQLFWGKRTAKNDEGLRETLVGTSFGYLFNSRSNLDAIYQHSQDDRHLGSLYGRYGITERVTLQGESSIADEGDYGYLADMDIDAPYVAIHTRVHHLSGDFPGRIEDQAGHRLFLNSSWHHPVSAWFKYRYYHDNTDRKSDDPTNHTRQLATGTYYRGAESFPSLGFTVDWTRLMSNSDSPIDHENRQSLILTYHQGIGRYNLSGRARQSWVQNHLTGRNGTGQDVFAIAGTRWGIVDLGTRLRWAQSTVPTEDPRLRSGEGTVQIPAGPGFVLGLTKFTWTTSQGDNSRVFTRSLEGGYQMALARFTGDFRYQHKLVIGDTTEGDGHEHRHKLRAALRWLCSEHHELQLHTDWDVSSKHKDEFRIILTYTTRFGIPLPFLKWGSTVGGRVYSPEQAYAMTRVHLDGLTTYTDDDGMYRFPKVQPGVHNLEVDTKRVPSRWTVDPALPRSVTVNRGETVVEDIQFIPSPEAPEPAAEEPVPPRPIEIQRFSPVSI